MWPPSSDDSLFARSTIAIAFQRRIDRSRRSTSGSPGSCSSRSGGIVFTYGVVSPTSTCAPEPRASLTTLSISCWARSGPSSRSTASSASSHSWVSWGSTSRGITAMSVVLEVLGVVVADVWQVRENHAQVVTKRVLGGVGLAAADGGDDGLVLFDHLGDVAGLGQAQAAHTVQVPVRARDNRPCDRAPAELAQARMKLVVEHEERARV